MNNRYYHIDAVFTDETYKAMMRAIKKDNRWLYDHIHECVLSMKEGEALPHTEVPYQIAVITTRITEA